VFLLLAVVMLVPLLTILFMKRSVAEKGARIGAE
jgi:DHA2 family multidrug resistance protein